MPRARDPNRPLPPASKKAKILFTNRVNETTRFVELLNAPEGSPLPLLMFYGVGGAGKTTLIQHLQRKCAELGLPSAMVDLAEAREADEALPRLAAYLEQRHGMQFKGFKRVMAVLAAKETGGVVTPKIVEGITTSGHIAGIALEGLGLLPVIGQIAIALKLGKDAMQLALNKAMKSNQAFSVAVGKIGGEKELFELIRRDEPELREELLRRFAADLVSSLPERDAKSGRGVLFFDQHEVLWRDERGGAFSQDAWIRQLREYLHGQGVLIVVSGRDHLRWPKDWQEEDGKGQRIWLEEHLVGGLSRTDAVEFLHRADVEDYPTEKFRLPKALQTAILRVTDEKTGVEGSGSHHCYLLTLCAGIIANTKAQTGEYPDPAIFNQIPEGEDASEPIVTRFLTSLHNEAMVLWLQDLSLTPRFDEDYVLSLDAYRRHNNGRSGWVRLRQLSLLKAREGGFWEMHKLLREALSKRVDGDTAKALHAWSEQYWSEGAGEDDWNRKGLAWYHHRFVDHADAIAEFWMLIDDAQCQAKAQMHRQLADWWRDVDLAFEPKRPDQAEDLIFYANSLLDLSIGNPTENLRRAIKCYEAALCIYTEADFPEKWAMTQFNLGIAYLNLTAGSRSENLRKAISCYEAALRVCTESDFRGEWAGIMNNLGNAYINLPTGECGENLQRAIDCYKAALGVYTEEGFPAVWATTQSNLGNAYSQLPTGNQGENLRRAIDCYEAALRVQIEAYYPAGWARTLNNLGNAYRELPDGNRAENLRRAISCYEATLRVYMEADFPNRWAMIQNNLGHAYRDLGIGNQGENLRKAIGYYEAALRVYTETDFSADWAATQNNLGNAYLILPAGDRGENMCKAIGYYEAALRVYTETDFPDDWANIQNNMGIAERERSISKRS